MKKPRRTGWQFQRASISKTVLRFSGGRVGCWQDAEAIILVVVDAFSEMSQESIGFDF